MQLKNYCPGFVTQVIIAPAFLAKISLLLDFNGNLVYFFGFLTRISVFCNLHGDIQDRLYWQDNIENQIGIH